MILRNILILILPLMISSNALSDDVYIVKINGSKIQINSKDFSLGKNSYPELVNIFGKQSHDYTSYVWLGNGINAVNSYLDSNCIRLLYFFFGESHIATHSDDNGYTDYDKSPGFQGKFFINSLEITPHTTLDELQQYFSKKLTPVPSGYQLYLGEKPGREVTFSFNNSGTNKGTISQIALYVLPAEDCEDSK